MVGGVEPRTLKNDFGGGDNFLQCLLAALGAGFQWIIVEGLLAFKLDTTILTAISIDGHTKLSLLLSSFRLRLRHYSLHGRG